MTVRKVAFCGGEVKNDKPIASGASYFSLGVMPDSRRPNYHALVIRLSGAFQLGDAFIFWPVGLRIRPEEPRFGAGFAIRRVLQCLPQF